MAEVVNGVKVGDRVRLTCGGSTLVGTVPLDVRPEGIYVLVDGDRTRYFSSSKWAVEVIAPPIPDVVGTIVRDCDDFAWQCYGFWWRRAGSAIAYKLPEVNDLSGPLTVLWTPEDQS